MNTRSLTIAILFITLALPISTIAQSDVNREKYPDYNDCLNPDYTMLQTAYNLQGIKVLKPVKGNIYIRGGKKFYVK